MCFPQKEWPEKKHINKFLAPTQSRNNPTNLFMFMCFFFSLKFESPGLRRSGSATAAAPPNLAFCCTSSTLKRPNFAMLSGRLPLRLMRTALERSRPISAGRLLWETDFYGGRPHLVGNFYPKNPFFPNFILHFFQKRFSMFPSFFFFLFSAFFCLSFSSLPLLFDILKPKIKRYPPGGVSGIFIYLQCWEVLPCSDNSTPAVYTILGSLGHRIFIQRWRWIVKRSSTSQHWRCIKISLPSWEQKTNEEKTRKQIFASGWFCLCVFSLPQGMTQKTDKQNFATHPVPGQSR